MSFRTQPQRNATLRPLSPLLPALTADMLVSRVLYRDALALIINKPAGMPVHGGPGGGPNIELYVDALRFGLPRPPGLAHRLDRDTSGCLILGRHRQALARLGKLFMQGLVHKTYWAIVAGQPSQSHGVIDLPLRKQSPDPRHWHMEGHPDGQPAVTEYEVLGSNGVLSWLELKPRTGRTHQIRVHCLSLGCPLLGDPAYGGPEAPAPGGLHLLARSVTLPLYGPQKPAIIATAPPPPHMWAALRACGWSDSDVTSQKGLRAAAGGLGGEK